MAATGSWEWDLATGRLRWSEEAGRIFGMPAEDCPDSLETLLRVWVHPDDRPRVAAAHHCIREGRRVCPHRFRIVLPGGQERALWVEGDVVRDGRGQSLRALGTVQDVTERKQMESGDQRLQLELAHASRLSLLGEMAAGLAHELNQPLCGIVSAAQGGLRLLAGTPAAPPELADALHLIQTEARRAAAVIQHVRSFVRKQPTPRCPHDLNCLIADACELIRGAATQRGVAIRLRLAPDLPRVSLDRVEIQQVILNLLQNGLEALEAVPTEKRRLTVESRVNGSGEVEVAIHDTGVGLAPEVAARLFTPFFSTKPEGLGLGLSISQTMVEAHGGRIWATADGAPGACFRFTLPVTGCGQEHAHGTKGICRR